MRGSNGYDSVERVKLMKLLWDALGTEFGGRHELYERNYAGNHENIRLEMPVRRPGHRPADAFKAFAEQCMAEYDLDGWRAPTSRTRANFPTTCARGADQSPRCAGGLLRVQLRGLGGHSPPPHHPGAAAGCPGGGGI